MKFVEPQVYLIAETRIDFDQLQKMLTSLGQSTARTWLAKTKAASNSDGELLTEVAGRTCYKSFGVGLNPNITKIRQSSEEYIQNTLAKGDGSIFEHATCTFAFLNVSRVFCYSSDTQVLTGDGWKTFDNVNGTEHFPTLNPKTFAIEYHPATNYIVNDYRGDMVHIQSSMVDLLMTPNHRVFIFDYDKRSNLTRTWKIEAASSLLHRRFRMKTDGIWNAPDIPKMVIDSSVISAVRSDTGTKYEREYESLELPFDNYASFLGFFSAEGSLGHTDGGSYQISIYQNEDSPHLTDILESVEGIRFSPAIFNVGKNTKEKVVRFYSYQLYQHLQKSGTDAKDKRVPTEIKTASSRQIRLYLDAYTKGDGNIHSNNGHMVIYTSSKQMTDDLQELALKAGFSASIRIDDRVGERHYNAKCGGWVQQTSPGYIVSFRQKNSLQPMVNQKGKKRRDQVTLETYSGKVYCVSVPPNELLYVRRNGKPVWCGNTHELVRHRPGVAISQESLRYVRPSEFYLWLPPELRNKKSNFQSIIGEIEDQYHGLEKSYDWNEMNFDLKKRITSAIRRILPEGMATTIIWSANHRAIRHVITMRTAESAEVEIRFVFDKVARIMKEKFPLIYEDFQYTQLHDETRSWRPKHVKV